MRKTDDLSFMSATVLSKRIRKKEISPVEVVDFFLQRIEDLNPTINAFCTVAADQARQDAVNSEKEIMMGNSDIGLLHGVPIAIKDLTRTKGIRTTFGSKVFADYVPTKDSIVVRRIKEAGGIIIGKTNTPEFGHKGTTDNQLFGTTKNPWNPDLTSGGSSGGSAAAVAAGLVPLAEGSDGGGSIRIPASFCGVFGLKPTYGRIPFDGIENNMFSSQNPFLHHGPISRSVDDAALLYSVMSGYDPSDPFVLPNTDDFTIQKIFDGIQGLRIAYSPDLGLYEIDPQVQEAMNNVVRQLHNLGCRVEEVNLDFEMSREDITHAFSTLWITQVATNYRSLLPDYEHALSEDIRKMIHFGEKISAVDYKDIEFVQTKIWKKVQEVFNDYDLLVSPTLAVPAFSHTIKGPKIINEKKINPNLDWMLTTIFNLTGHPAASIPAPVKDNQLPVGIQVVGRRMEEKNIFRLAYAFEQANLKY